MTGPEIQTPPTVVAAVEALASRPTAITVYDRRGKKATTRPYPELAQRARAWGAWLQSQGVKEGEVVFLCLPTSHELVEAFLGAVLIRALPCNLALPRAVGGLEVFRRRLERLAEPFPGGHLITTDAVGPECGRPFWTPPELDLSRVVSLEPVEPERLAYIQLTSGSTTTPKAVAISHRNLAANVAGIQRAGGSLGEAEDHVSWLPLYHDMGLVGMCFAALFHGCGLVLMPPEAFVGTPQRWLEAIASRVGRRVVTAAPNFGYQWCVDRIKEPKLAGLDLSPLRYACCGAEMVRPETMDAFRARFSAYGLSEEVLAPCYGMAETTLAVTMTPPGRRANLHEGRVSCGAPIAGMTLKVQDPETGADLPDREEGEIVIAGSSVFEGYFGNPAATQESLRGDAYRSGDLGYLHEGELYVTGRLKDLIILDGVNVAPYELEWIAEETVVVPGGRAGAFAVDPDGREVPVLVAEVREVPEAEVLDALLARIAQDVAPLHDLVLVRRGTLPKTSSGKVQRKAVKECYLAGTLETLWSKRGQAEETP